MDIDPRLPDDQGRPDLRPDKQEETAAEGVRFKHPGDAMRAKILGRLNCVSCTAFHNGNQSWCNLHQLAPNTKALKDQICADFSYNPDADLVRNMEHVCSEHFPPATPTTTT